MEQALVFDIKRFAVHDGSGIRTTVFFKGCNMRCRWCQNPEGLEPVRHAVWLENRCLHCGTCMKERVPGQLEEKEGRIIPNRSYDGDFDRLVHDCPTGALCYDSRIYTTEELMNEIRRDEVFFRHGGGVTFSGGEPLLHWKAMKEVLQMCREADIKTAIETALFADPEAVREVLPLLDEVFADFKCRDDNRHREITGVSNVLIMCNLEYVLQNAKGKVTVRTPLIPGYTASHENIAGIASFLAALRPDVTYELLNYNELAPAKYKLTGMIYEPGERKRFSDAEMEKFRSTARENGLRNVI